MGCDKEDKKMSDEDEDDEVLDENWVQAFKSGTHTDSAGATKTWTDADVEKIAASYNKSVATDNPARRIAPVVLGHPTMDAPAYGWIEKAKAMGGKLMLKLTELQPQFVSMLKQGMYKTRSISLYPDNNIRHLGFLGAAQPAVAGLAPFKFAEEKYETYDFQEEPTDLAQANMVNELKQTLNWYEKLFKIFKIDTDKHLQGVNMAAATVEKPVEVTPVVTPEAVVAPVVVAPAPVVPEPIKPEAVVAEAIKSEAEVKYAEAQAKIATLQTELDALKASSLVDKATQAVKSYTEFCDGLVAVGKLKPADKAIVVENLRLRAESDKTNNFSEADEKSQLSEYKSYLQSMPVVVEMSELIVGKAPVAPKPEDKNRVFCETAISDMLKANPKMLYHEAFSQITRTNPVEMQSFIESGLTN